jgi:hypothetical protein
MDARTTTDKKPEGPGGQTAAALRLKMPVSFLTERRLHIVRTDYSLAF